MGEVVKDTVAAMVLPSNPSPPPLARVSVGSAVVFVVGGMVGGEGGGGEVEVEEVEVDVGLVVMVAMVVVVVVVVVEDVVVMGGVVHVGWMP